MRVRRRGAAVAATLLTSLCLGAAAAAAAQPVEQDQAVADAPLELRLTELTGVLGPGASASEADGSGGDDAPPVDLAIRASVEHVGDTELDQLRVVVEVHPAATSRGDLRAALDRGGRPTGSAVAILEQDLREDRGLAPGEVAGLEAVLDEDDVPWSERGGVHPVRVLIMRGGDVLARTTTAVVWLAEPPTEPMLTTVLWPIDTPPWRRAGGTYPTDVGADLRAGARIDAQLRAVERRPDVAVVLAPPAHLLEDLRDRADGFLRTERVDGGAVEQRRVAPEDAPARASNALLQRFREVLGATPIAPVPRPYADADLSAIAGSAATQGLAGELARLGRIRLDAVGERSADQRAYLLPIGTDPEVLDVVPADTVLLPFGAVEGPDLAADPTLPPSVRDVTSASGRPVTAIVGDPYVTELLGAPNDEGSLVAVQRVLVETAMIHFEAPGTGSRALSVHPPDGWTPSAETADRLLGRLASAPWLQLTDPGDLAERARRGPPAELRGTDDDAGFDEARGERLVTAVDDLEAATDAREDPTTDLGSRSPADLRDALLRSTSRWYPAGSAGSDGLVADVETVVEDALADVTIASGSLVTLTSDSGTIPVTLQRTSGDPLEVQVEVSSQGRLAWPEGRRSTAIVLEEGSTQTVTFPIRALSTGTFPVTVRVTDPSGRLELDRTTLSVRSTSISGPALSIIGGSVVLLLLAGLVRRRPRRRRLEVVR